jgi:hypothetical protein
LRSHSWTCRFHCQDEQKHLHETGLLLHINKFFFFLKGWTSTIHHSTW